MQSLSSELRRVGLAHVQVWQALPLVAGISRGDADRDWFRFYLEQDYVYLTSYVRLFAKLAGGAPDNHVEHLVGLAWNVAEVEVGHHREVGTLFGCDFDNVVPSKTCVSYIEFLQNAAADFGSGLVAALPCLWGYGQLCRLMPLPPEGPYRTWAETYRTARYETLVERHCAMIDEAAPDRECARTLFTEALEFEAEFWNQKP